VDLGKIGGSALTSPDIRVPSQKNFQEIKNSREIPVTYVPARNLIFLSYALAYAEVIEAEAIFSGVNAVDYSSYPDCRPGFIKKFQELAKMGTKRGIEGGEIKIEAPVIEWESPLN
jgi:7-cyano-7-deazaguanine synthase